MNESVENMTALNPFEGEIWTSEMSNQNIVMNEQFVKNMVMNAKTDPKVVMNLSKIKIVGWNNLAGGLY